MNDGRILILDLLDVFKRYSDKDNTLSQKDVIEILENKYGYKKVRRQTIQSNIEKIIDHYELNDRLIRLAAEDKYFDNEDEDFDEIKRRITNIYYEHKLSDSELLLIIDSILFSKQIPFEDRRDLIKKLEGLSSIHFNYRMGNISSMSDNSRKYGEIEEETIFDKIKEIDRAITESKKISIKYKNYKVSKNKIRLENRKNSEGEEREYIINPYHMAASNGRYYLICNNDLYDNVSTYRIDRITNIKILDENRKPIKHVKGLGENFNLNDYMEENIYMFGGESEYIKLSLKKEFLDEFIDWFKLEDINVQEEKDDEIIVRVKSNRMAMRRWGLRYGLYTRVLSPTDLVEEIKEDIKKVMENYK